MTQFEDAQRGGKIYYYRMILGIFCWSVKISKSFGFVGCSLPRFWFFKVAGIVAITVGAFYIPDGPFTLSKYLQYAKSKGKCHAMMMMTVKLNYSVQFNEKNVTSSIPVPSAFFFSLVCTHKYNLVPAISDPIMIFNNPLKPNHCFLWIVFSV